MINDNPYSFEIDNPSLLQVDGKGSGSELNSLSKTLIWQVGVGGFGECCLY
jgi:hypothetical protein